MTETSETTVQAIEKPIKFKIVMLGDQAVGKTSIIKNYTRGIFELKQPSTIGIDYMSKAITIGGRQAVLELWDTAGQQRFRSLIPNYLRNCSAVLVVFDLTRESSFKNVSRWRDFSREVKGLGLRIFYVGNKVDLQSDRTVSSQAIESMIERQECQYFQTSAKDRQCLQKMFQNVAHILLQDHQLMNSIDCRSRIMSLDDIPVEQQKKNRFKNCC